MVSQYGIVITFFITSDCYCRMNAESKEGHEPRCALPEGYVTECWNFHRTVTNGFPASTAEFSTSGLEAITAGGATGATTCTKPEHPRCARPYLACFKRLRAALSPVDGSFISGDKGRRISGEENHAIRRTALPSAAPTFTHRKAGGTEALPGPLQACEGGQRKPAARKTTPAAPGLCLNPAGTARGGNDIRALLVWC